MKKYSVIAVTGFFLVLFFQNCGAPPANMDAETQAGLSPSGQQYNKYSVQEFPTLSLWDFNHNRFLDLDLQSGQMVAYEQGGQVRGETFQLRPQQIEELQSILDSAEICEPIIDPQDREGRMCSMAYRYPYAILLAQGEEVRLGEKADSCDLPVDLCGDKAKILQGWVTKTVNSLE